MVTTVGGTSIELEKERKVCCTCQAQKNEEDTEILDPYWWLRWPNTMCIIALVLSIISVVISCLPRVD